MSEHKFPVTEIFGPTIQGEGPLQGEPCLFLRLGGCDYKCVWCDSPHAVLPELVRQNKRMTADEILVELNQLAVVTSGQRVVISGGNPMLHNLSDIVKHVVTFKWSVETQGTKWMEWIKYCDSVVVSPKPPSSQMIRFDRGQLINFMDRCYHYATYPVLKIVVFDHLDYEFAQVIHQTFPHVLLYLSAGNDAGKTVGNPGREDNRSETKIAEELIMKGRWLANRVMVDPLMQGVRVQMQQHVLFWGNGRGH